MDDDVITEIYLVDGSTYNDDYPLFRDWATTEPTEDAGVAHVDWTIQADTVGIVDSPDIDSLVIHYIQHANYQPGKHLAIGADNKLLWVNTDVPAWETLANILATGNINDFGTKSHTSLTDIGTLTHANLDSAVAIIPMWLSGTGGFIISATYGAAWGVALSDTDASIRCSAVVPLTGTYKIQIYYFDSVDDHTKTAAGHLSVGAYATTETIGFGLQADLDWSLAMGTASQLLVATSASAYAVTAGDHVNVMWAKTDNAGGATGNLLILSIALVKQ